MRKSTASTAGSNNREKLSVLGAPVEVRRHAGARRLTLRVSRTRRAVIVTLPLQCDLGEAGSFLNRNIDWVRARLDSLPQPVQFSEGAFMPLRGETHQLVFTGKTCTGRQGAIVRHEAGPFPQLHVSGETEHAPRRITDWLAAQAKSDLMARVAHHASTLNVKPKRVAVRDQASRWGSCSTTSVLSFSWRLVLAPPAILDYVAAHEVAHLREMNHGPRFWALVRQTFPDLDEAKRWLQIYGLDLHRYGASEA
ncbi:MAG: SprT family zinc-dependent metalloprotease [Hyphomicrobium sp.]